MAAVTADAKAVTEALKAGAAPHSVVVANRNSPGQTVIAGPTDAVAEAVRLLREAGLGAQRIPVACAFHSPLVAGAADRFAGALADRPVHAPEFPVWSNRTAAPYPADADAVRAGLAAQISAPVAFAEQIEAMYAAGARVFVEAGPGSVLTRLVGQILGDRPHRTVACEPRPGSGLGGWLDAWPRSPSRVCRCARGGCCAAGTPWTPYGRPCRSCPAGRSTDSWSAPPPARSYPVRSHRPDESRRPRRRQ